METKSIWKSKALWFNVVTIALGIIQVVAKTYTIPTEILALIVGIGNILLRMFSDNVPLTVGGKRIDGK